MPGKSYRFGDGDDHHVFLFHLDKPYQPSADDLTLEILMHGVDPQAARVFMSGPQRKKEFIREKSGVWSILPGFQVGDYLFEPMGYSLNAIRGAKYYTIHVTPQKNGSYVSFETNCVEATAARRCRACWSCSSPSPATCCCSSRSPRARRSAAATRSSARCARAWLRL